MKERKKNNVLACNETENVLRFAVFVSGNKYYITHKYFAGNPAIQNSVEFLQNLDSLKESVRLAGSGTYKWDDLDLSQFQGQY